MGYIDETRYVRARVLPMWSVVTKCTYLIPHLYISSNWLIAKIKYAIISMLM